MCRSKIKRLVSKNPKYPLNKVDALVALLKELKKYSHHYYNGELYIQFEKTYLVYPNEYLISDIKRLLQNKWNTTAEKYILPELRTRIKTRMKTDLSPWNFYQSNGHIDTIKNRFVSIDEYEADRFIIPVSPVPYDFDATCPNFDKWLEELYEGDPNSKKKILLLEEVLATVLLPNNFEKAFILYGETFNGKSTFCNVAKFMVTESSDVEMRDFQNKNAILPFGSQLNEKPSKKHPGNGGCFLDSDQNVFLKRVDKLGKSRYDKSIYARINRFVKKTTVVMVKCLFSRRKTIYTHNEKVITSLKLLVLFSICKCSASNRTRY